MRGRRRGADSSLITFGIGDLRLSAHRHRKTFNATAKLTIPQAARMAI